MNDFFKTIHCQSRAHCQTCRDLEKGRPWREQILRIFKTNVISDFVCPYGIEWGVKSEEAMSKIVVSEQRPSATLKQAKTFGKAVLTGEYVSKEILEERVAICGKCEFLRVDPNGLEWCAVCGCKTSADDRSISNLAAYKEGPIDSKSLTPQWGCKHPQRKYGAKGWKR